jgi:hypothetical protein
MRILNEQFEADPTRNHCGGRPETAKRDSERFQQIQKEVFEAAGFVQGDAPHKFEKPSDADRGWQPKPVNIRLQHGKVVTVNHSVAIQRILQNQASLVA